MMTSKRCHDPRHTPPKSEDLLAEFDRLLEESSLGTPAAKAIRALTPQEVAESLEARTGTRPTPSEPNSDADDVLLALVRTAANFSSDPASATNPSLSVPWWESADEPVQEMLALYFCGHSATSTGRMAMELMLFRLLETEVFQCVRTDVARSIVEIGFTDTRPIILEACHAAVVRCEVAEEFSALLMTAGAHSVVAEVWPAQLMPGPALLAAAERRELILPKSLILGAPRSAESALTRRRGSFTTAAKRREIHCEDVGIIDAEVVGDVADLSTSGSFDRKRASDGGVDLEGNNQHRDELPKGPAVSPRGAHLGCLPYILDDEERTRRARILLWHAGLVSVVVVSAMTIAVALSAVNVVVAACSGLAFFAGRLFHRPVFGSRR
jgi:hypothetical protein